MPSSTSGTRTTSSSRNHGLMRAEGQDERRPARPRAQKTLVRAFSIMGVLPSDPGVVRRGRVVGLVLVAPVDAGRVGRVDDGGAPAVREGVPRPGDEGVDAGPGGAHQPGVDPEPGAVGDGAVQLVVVGADLGDGGPPADHGHDALVVVAEGGGRHAGEVGQDAGGRGPAGLHGHRAQLRVGACRRGPPRRPRRRWRTRRGSPATDRSWPAVMRPPRPRPTPSVPSSGGTVRPPAQTTQRVGISEPSPSTTLSAVTSSTEVPSSRRTPLWASTSAA